MVRTMTKEIDAYTGIITHNQHYQVLNQDGKEMDAWREVHKMRAFSPPELRYAMKGMFSDIQFRNTNEWYCMATGRAR